MPDSNRIKCTYCSTLNSSTRETCLACGAPLKQPKTPTEIKIAAKSSDETVSTAGKQPTDPPDFDGEDIEELASKGLFYFSIVWRTLAEALVIGITAFCMGLSGGACSASIPAILASVIYGAVVGNTIKQFSRWLLTLVIGLVGGILAGGLLYLFFPRLYLSVLLFSIICILSASLGGKRLSWRQKNLWEKLRPFIGAAGGLAAGLFGTAVGWGLSELVKSIVS